MIPAESRRFLDNMQGRLQVRRRRKDGIDSNKEYNVWVCRR
jgi:hypothetical protein